MANTVTYATALTTMRDFAIANGFDNTEVIDKINALVAQKSKTNANKGKTEARKKNEVAAQNIIDVMNAQNVNEIDNKWVRDNIADINSPARATAVLNVAVDMGLLNRNIITKSATRNTCTYTLA